MINAFHQYVWLIPALPLLAAGWTAILKQPRRQLAASLAIGSMACAFVLSCAALFALLARDAENRVLTANFNWFQLGDAWVRLGWLLDPLSVVMLMMVSLVGLLIFIYSAGYMAADRNFTRFFCFLSLFAAAMLGLIIANSLLLLFICWELVGLTSYLLIGFWYHKPSAVAAAQKAFITTRIGDLAFLLGMVWLYGQTGTLVFYDGGAGCLEQGQLAALVTRGTIFGMTVSTGISFLLLVGAMGKSGQVPFHTWLPDAMEGPTPVSALIHAATMVAAGVFLMARIFPLAAAASGGAQHALTPALMTTTWVGAITALFAASIAVAQTDIKRILAYSTVSQLGYMMMGLGAGGVAIGMFHLLTHGFFKALLFLGAGSVIHGCHGEQDIRAMGGLRSTMKITFATYAVGMLALSGFPLLFAGFWSKDEILHATHSWQPSQWPFYIGLAGAFLTAFYMTRQMVYVFFGKSRPAREKGHHRSRTQTRNVRPHESPGVMTTPLAVLAAGSVLLGFLGTPAWPWVQSFLNGVVTTVEFSRLTHGDIPGLMALSAVVALGGIAAGCWLYARKPIHSAETPDPLQTMRPDVYHLLGRKYFVDELYKATIIRWHRGWARSCAFLDDYVLVVIVRLIEYATVGLSWVARLMDEFLVNPGFDKGCRGLFGGGKLLALVQNGQTQRYLRVLAAAAAVLGLFLLWGCGGP